MGNLLFGLRDARQALQEIKYVMKSVLEKLNDLFEVDQRCDKLAVDRLRQRVAMSTCRTCRDQRHAENLNTSQDNETVENLKELSRREYLHDQMSWIDDQMRTIWKVRIAIGYVDAHMGVMTKLQSMKAALEHQLFSSEFWTCERCSLSNKPIFTNCQLCGGERSLNLAIADFDNLLVEFVRDQEKELEGKQWTRV